MSLVRERLIRQGEEEGKMRGITKIAKSAKIEDCVLALAFLI
jgi:hypothetical protein